jgi:hypothetical protein
MICKLFNDKEIMLMIMVDTEQNTEAFVPRRGVTKPLYTKLTDQVSNCVKFMWKAFRKASAKAFDKSYLKHVNLIYFVSFHKPYKYKDITKNEVVCHTGKVTDPITFTLLSQRVL